MPKFRRQHLCTSFHFTMTSAVGSTVATTLSERSCLPVNITAYHGVQSGPDPSRRIPWKFEYIPPSVALTFCAAYCTITIHFMGMPECFPCRTKSRGDFGYKVNVRSIQRNVPSLSVGDKRGGPAIRLHGLMLSLLGVDFAKFVPSFT